MKVAKAAVIGLAIALGTAPAAAQILPLEEITVSGPRLRPSAVDRALSIRRLLGAGLRQAPQGRLDDMLRQVPGVGLFRRASSLSAHPTTQGVTLRALGPNGAGRTLVLVDGVPVNDPFGGWVYWSALAPETVEQIEIIRGGGAGRWGNGALAGTIAIHSRFAAGETLSAQFKGGSFETFEGRGAVFLEAGQTRLFLAAHHFDSDGFFLLPQDQRGPVDLPAASDATSVQGGLEAPLGQLRFLAKLAYFDEGRVNGLDLARNATKGWQASLHLVKETSREESSWQVNAYFQDREFKSSFAAVDDLRTTERPVLDQFDVPGRGFGLNGLLRLALGAGKFLEAGLDLRRMEGETNERFRNLGAGFTRQRLAGGEQFLAGAFAELILETSERLTLSGSARLDHWRLSNGKRLESDLQTGVTLRDDTIPDRNGWVANGRIAARFRLNERSALRLAAYSGFRLPTINEFFRPFRVRNDITEANPALKPERLYGIDLGFDHSIGKAATLRATFFQTWLVDGVGNVTLALGPGNFPPTGFVPAGGSLRQRQNIDRITSQGLEIELEWRAGEDTGITFGYLYANPKVRRFDAQPELKGKRLIQSPRHQASLSLGHRPIDDLRVAATARWVGKAFDDDLNERVLADFLVLDLRLDFALSEALGLFVAAENLLNRKVQSAVSVDGLVTLAAPRIVSGGLRVGF
jgi:outer membrane receptor protein involved in Fe transport